MTNFSQIKEIVDALFTGPRWYFVGAFCVVLTQVLRWAKWFHWNEYIWLAVPTVGGLLFLAIGDPNMFGPFERGRYVMLFCGGFMLGFAGWALSASLLTAIKNWLLSTPLGKFLPSDIDKNSTDKIP